MISEIISHYRILSKLGAGGMGEVYLAEDMRLGRRVALKFLPASYQYDPDRRTRFLQEARAASALRSPNIAAIYDIGEHDGVMFIVMEYVEGELLSAKVKRSPLAARETIDIARQVADALDDAHGLNIIHRDIKSSNLMVTARGLVKMLDFGLAKVLEHRLDKDSSDVTVPLGQATMPGIVLGTVSYMSPEQAYGRTLDNRTDIFSLGVVIYEMVTGRLPFDGASVTEIIDNILHQEPTAIARLNTAVPPQLERIIRRCMEKNRELRYASAGDLSADLLVLLKEIDSGPVSTSSLSTSSSGMRARASGATRSRKSRGIDSLAILPLANASGDPDMEYLSDGITESIITNLSQLPKLKVMARSTVFRYKGTEINPLQVGRELDVRALLTGRVLQRGDVLIIKVELVDTNDGAHLWGEQYNRPMADIFAVEEEISNVISDKLKLRLNVAQKKRLAKRHTQNTEAYQLYLKGRFYWNKRTEEHLKKGIEFFEQAIARDSKYALAYAGLADSYNILVSYSSRRPDEAFPKAKIAATRALELDPLLSEAHTSLAFVEFGYDWNFSAAERAFKQAIEINPGYANAHYWYGLMLAALGRFDEAKAEVKCAQELDPLSLPINANAGWLYYLARNFDRAIEKCRKTIEIEPAFALAHRRLGEAFEQVGMYNEASAEYETALKLAGHEVEVVAARGHLYAIVGKPDKAREAIDELNDLSKTRYVPAYLISRIHIGLGEHDEAFDLLERAYQERYGFLVYLKVDPIFDPLRPDSRFADLSERVGLK